MIQTDSIMGILPFLLYLSAYLISVVVCSEIPIYWLNLDSMPDRAISISRHLTEYGFKYHRRITALTPKTCNLLMYECQCARVGINDIAILCSHLSALYIALNDNNQQ